jgi:hypothetical protein
MGGGNPSPCVGFVDLGLMGSRMARRLLAHGVDLLVCDVDRAAVDALVAEGAKAAATPAEFGAGSDVVFCMLPTPAALGGGSHGGDFFRFGRRRGLTPRPCVSAAARIATIILAAGQSNWRQIAESRHTSGT